MAIGDRSYGDGPRGEWLLNGMKAALRVTKRILPDAFPPLSGASPTGQEAPDTFGWLMGALPAPQKDDRYLVRFASKDSYDILAYMDRYGRVFTTSTPITTPPTREPDLKLEIYEDLIVPDMDLGAVYVRHEDEMVFMCPFQRRHGRYTITRSWYNFGPYANDLTLDDAMARTYLAFVYRPKKLGAPVHFCTISDVFGELQQKTTIPALFNIVQTVDCACYDEMINPPGLLQCLAQWLEEAGAVDLYMGIEHGNENALRLIRTIKHSNMFYLGVEKKGLVPLRTVWKLEAALNRFLLVGWALDTYDAEASVAECVGWDAYLIETIGEQVHDAAHPDDEQREAPAGEWELRSALAAVTEDMRLPFRCPVRFRCDVDGGTAAFEMVAPDADMMPATYWDAQQESWEPVASADRQALALRYALRLGVLLAAAAFHGSSAVERVAVTSRPFTDEDGAGAPSAGPAGEGAAPAADRKHPASVQEPLFYQVTFDRERFCDADAFRHAAQGDPLPLYRWCGALFGPAAGEAGAPSAGASPATGDSAALATDPFALVDEGASALFRSTAPDGVHRVLSPAAQQALGAQATEGLCVHFAVKRRQLAERLADRIAAAPTTTERTRMVLAVQDAHADDRLVGDACTRLMTALAEGTVDTEDQNALMGCFLGDDPLAAAMVVARDAVPANPAKALEALTGAVALQDGLGYFQDTPEKVYRMFDSYGSRVVYNLAVSGELELPGFVGASDAGKQVELAPDALYYCCLQAMMLHARSFDQTDEALQLADRCIRMAPSVAVGYRHKARVYMLVGDLDCARETLFTCLQVALQSEDVAYAYYQLGYVEWKAGRLQAAVACYVRSILESSAAAKQAEAELKEVLEEGGRPLSPDEVIPEFERAGIPVVPTRAMIDVLDAAAAAAVDEGLFPVARNLLALRLRHCRDDVLMNVLHSLEDQER